MIKVCKMDALLPGIRAMCEDLADDIATARYEHKASHLIAFRPKVRAFLEITEDFLHASGPLEASSAIKLRMEQVKTACEYAINDVFEGIQDESDITIEFSLGAQPPRPTI